MRACREFVHGSSARGNPLFPHFEARNIIFKSCFHDFFSCTVPFARNFPCRARDESRTRASVLKLCTRHMQVRSLKNLHKPVACESIASQSRASSFCFKFVLHEASKTIEHKQLIPRTCQVNSAAKDIATSAKRHFLCKQNITR